jgi:hypothetical protein
MYIDIYIITTLHRGGRRSRHHSAWGRSAFGPSERLAGRGGAGYMKVCYVQSNNLSFTYAVNILLVNQERITTC